MKTKTQAICWELWRTSRVAIAASLCITIGIVLAFQGFITAANLDGSIEALMGLIVLKVMAMSTCSTFWMRELSTEDQGYTLRLGFTRPVSTRRLVLMRMSWAIATAIVCYLVPTTVFGLASGKPMPLFGPSLIIASAVACFIAATWVPVTIPEKSAGVVLVLVGLSLFLFEYHRNSGATDPYVLAIGKPGYFNLGWRSCVVLVAAMAGAVVVTVFGVGRQRHGNPISLVQWVSGLFSNSSTKATVRTTSFRSPTHAQLWFDFRRCAPRIFWVAVFGPLGAFALAKWALWMRDRGQSDFVSAWEGAPVLWGLGLVISPMVYHLVGVDAVLGLRSRDGVIRFSSFDATRPMSSERLLILKTLVVGVCSLVGWLWMWLGAILYAIFAEDGTVWPRIQQAAEQLGNVPSGWWFGAAVCLLMTFVGTTGMLMTLGMWLPRYPRRFAALFWVIYSFLGLAFVGHKMHWQLQSFWVVSGYVFAVGLILMTVYAIVVALRDRTLSVPTFGIVFALWIGFVVCNCLVVSKTPLPESIPQTVLIVAAAAMCIPLAATVCAPMALNSWRHQT